jgi:hypothetical protein
MAGRWIDFGVFGARGMPGWAALAQQLQEVVRATGVTSPITTRRGLAARLRYLDSPAGRAALAEAGVTVRPVVVRAWRAGLRRPRPATLDRVERAYLERRASNMIRSGALERHFDRAGAGTRMEIHPVDQTQVRVPRRRDLATRSVTVRYVWGDLVRAWGEGDQATMDEIWDSIINDLVGSDYDSYSYVSGVGFA